jgi:hypothetical protein
MPLLPAVRMVRSKLLPGIAALGLLRRMNRADAGRYPRDFFEGRVVRLRGTVSDDSLIRAPSGGSDAVVCRQLVRNALGGILSEGIFVHDFDLRLESGESVRVQVEMAAGVRALALLDGAEDHWEGQGMTRGWFCESRLRPGDPLEVVGTLLREIDPGAAAHGFRRAPLRWTLIAAPSQPLVLRFCSTAGLTPLPALKAVAG